MTRLSRFRLSSRNDGPGHRRSREAPRSSRTLASPWAWDRPSSARQVRRRARAKRQESPAQNTSGSSTPGRLRLNSVSYTLEYHYIIPQSEHVFNENIKESLDDD